MTVPYPAALAAMAVSLSVLMAGAFLVQQRTGNSGWVDTIWMFSLGLVGAGGAPWPVAGEAHPQARRFLPAAAARIIPKSGSRFSEKIMLKIEEATP